MRKGLLVDKSDKIAAMPDTSKLMKQVDFSKFDDSDDPDSDSDDATDDDDDAEEAELMREIERIKAERAADKARREEEDAAEAAEQQNEEFMKGNPLLNSTTFTVKRSWHEDAVFKNQTRGVAKVQKKFINDTIRSQFHRSFLKKYIQ